MRFTMHITPLAAAVAAALTASNGHAAPTRISAAASSASSAAAAPAAEAPAAQAPSPPLSAAPAPAAAPTPAPTSPTPDAPPAPAPAATPAPPAEVTPAPAAAAGSPAAPAAPATPLASAPASSPAPAKPGVRHWKHRAAPVAPPAAAATATDSVALGPFSLPAATLPRVDAWIGVRDVLIESRSYDPYSSDDQLPMFQARAGVGLGTLGAAGWAAVASVALGDSSASDRGAATELHVVRLGLGPELRIPVLDRLYVLGRLQPEAVRVSAQLQDETGQAFLKNSSWSFGVDAALGAALRLVDIPTGERTPGIGVFARVEAGYSWTASRALRLTASGSDAPLRSAPIELGALALSGASFGGAIGIGY